MEDSRWLKLMTVGLVLAAVAVGYFLFSGSFTSKKVVTQASPSPSVLGQNSQNSVSSPSSSPASSSSPKPAVSPTPAVSAIPQTAFEKINSRNQKGQSLPKTGFPVALLTAFAISALISGWGLRRFPK